MDWGSSVVNAINNNRPIYQPTEVSFRATKVKRLRQMIASAVDFDWTAKREWNAWAFTSQRWLVNHTPTASYPTVDGWNWLLIFLEVKDSNKARKVCGKYRSKSSGYTRYCWLIWGSVGRGENTLQVISKIGYRFKEIRYGIYSCGLQFPCPVGNSLKM